MTGTSSTAERLDIGRAVVAVAVCLACWTVASAVDRTAPQVLGSFPHDSGAFTQGLLLHEGLFYESTGLYGQSSLRRVDPVTGAVLLREDLGSGYFGEGLSRVDDRLIQLTWQENIAFVYDLATFAPMGSFPYSGQGWGLCHDGERLVMSNGSSTLTFRNADTFAVEGQVQVTRDGLPVNNLNELECVGDLVYANVWLTDTILRINPGNGQVLTEIGAAGLLTPAEEAQADVLNGIAFDPDTAHFYLTGKLWPRMFEVEFDFNPYGQVDCRVSWLREVRDVRLDRDGSDGVAFTWSEDPPAIEYHVNSVSSIADLAGAGAHRMDVPDANGVAECDALSDTTSCTDTDGQIAPEPILFYQVYSACGILGADEGPP